VLVKALKVTLMELHFTATGCHLPYGHIETWCYLPPDTSEHSPP